MNILNWLIGHCRNLLFGCFFATLGYFSPIKDIVHVMIAVIFVDFFVGLWASYRQGIGWKSEKMWRTIYKLILAVLIIMLLYAMDTEMGIEAIKTYKAVAWVICGFEIWSILENAAVISNHRIFIFLRHYMHDRVEKISGINIKEDQK